MRRGKIDLYLSGDIDMASKKQNPLSKYSDQSVSISNSVVRGKQAPSLLESKIEALVFYHMNTSLQVREKEDITGRKFSIGYVTIPAQEIISFIGRQKDKGQGGNTYETIRKTAIAMKSKLILFEDREARRFLARSLFYDVSYDRGILYVEINPEMDKYLRNLSSNYTRMRLAILFSFKKNAGFQMYRFLKSYAYGKALGAVDTSIPQNKFPVHKVSCSLAELRLTLGYTDINDEELRSEGSKAHPNWDKMIQTNARKNKYPNWTSFNTYVLKPGIKEINDVSDIYISGVETDSEGNGSRVNTLTFLIQHNLEYYLKHGAADPKHETVTADMDICLPASEPAERHRITDENKKLERVYALFSDETLKRWNISMGDVQAIADAADYDTEKVKRAYNVAQKTSGIQSFVGFMIEAIRKNYSIPEPAESKNVFNQFTQNKYDFKALEKALTESDNNMFI